MDIEQFREYCLSKPFTTEDFPFDSETLVFRVMGKIYALTQLEQEDPFVNLKCDPDRAAELRDQTSDIFPAFHMNKKHWNSVYLDHELTATAIVGLIDHSYDLVVAGLPKKMREEIKT